MHGQFGGIVNHGVPMGPTWSDFLRKLLPFAKTAGIGSLFETRATSPIRPANTVTSTKRITATGQINDKNLTPHEADSMNQEGKLVALATAEVLYKQTEPTRSSL